MEIGFIGLGRMGKSMALRLLSKKHKVVAYNRSPEPIRELEKSGAKGAYSLDDFFRLLKGNPRIVWIMLPAGQVTEEFIGKAASKLSSGDIIVDGGNSNYKDSIRRYETLKKKGIHFLDVGTSGGTVAAKIGYCIMAGGDKEAFKAVSPIFKSLTVDGGLGYMGPSGSGHYVKMVHNAIEYGMMQAMGEGFELLVKGPYGNEVDLKKIADVWNHGSIVRGFLMEMAESAFSKDSKLSSIAGYVDDSGEGRWAVNEAVDSGVAFNVISASLYARFSSRDKDAFYAKVLAALRNEFGGHEVKKK